MINNQNQALNEILKKNQELYGNLNDKNSNNDIFGNNQYKYGGSITADYDDVDTKEVFSKIKTGYLYTLVSGVLTLGFGIFLLVAINNVFIHFIIYSINYESPC